MTDDTEEDRIATIDEKIAAAAEQAVEKAVEKLRELLPDRSSSEGNTEADAPAEMTSTMRRELRRLNEEDAARAREKAEMDQLKEKVATIPEKRPREYRKSTNFMKWVTEDDK